MENQKTGYIPLYRSILKQSWAKDVYLRTLWENLLLNAARKPYKANFKGHEWHLQPGQLVVTAADLGLQLCDRHGKPASRDQVERMLQVFVKEGMISIDGEKQKGRVITITNYHEYAQKMDNSPAHEAAQTTAHDAAHDEASNGAAFSAHAAHESAHEAAQTTAHHEQEGINKNINNTPLPPNGGGDGQVKPERRKAERIDYESFLNAYNTEVGDRLPHAVAINEKRKRRLKKIIPQLKTPNVDGFRAYVRAFVHQAKPFYFGDNDTGWTADFDYLLREDSLSDIKSDYVSKTVTESQSLASPLDVKTSYSVDGIQVVGARNTGWTAATGTPLLGSFNANQSYTVGTTYTQSEVAALATGLQQARQRILALETALRLHGLID